MSGHNFSNEADYMCGPKSETYTDNPSLLSSPNDELPNKSNTEK